MWRREFAIDGAWKIKGKIAMSLPPQPTKNAKAVYEILAGVIGAFVPAAAALKPAMDRYLDKQMQQAQDMLMHAISERGITALNDEQFEFYVPAVYRFLEQVRIGEYEHNLKVLAALITQGVAGDPKRSDLGTIERAARKLELISNAELETLAATKVAWDQVIQDGPTLSSEGHMVYKAILDAHKTMGLPIELHDLAERLHELNVRGILRYSPPSGFFHGGYSPTRAYFEIIDAVADTVKKTNGP
ncbi:hypothetical protein LVY75_27110 [Sinorhizobium sp. B11]